MRSENTLRFANWISLILPVPGIFAVFPLPLTGIAAVVWFFLISAAALFSVGYLFYRTIRYFQGESAGKKSTGKMFRSLYSGDTDLSITAKTFLGALFFFYAIHFMFGIFNQPTPGLDILSRQTPIWIRMFLLGNASVWEEISGRLVLIGLPLFIYRSFIGHKGIQWKQLAGGTGTFGYGEVLLILMSASLFGLAHLGWGPWKVVPTFVHGLLFGYLFVKVGLHASISMHLLFDYTGIFNEITGISTPTWTIVAYTSIFIGGLFLGDIVHRFHGWGAWKMFGRPPKPFIQLIVHSTLSVVIGLLLVWVRGIDIYSILFLSVPLVDFTGYVLWRMTGSVISRFIVMIGSYVSWAASPFGFAWAVAPDVHSRDTVP